MKQPAFGKTPFRPQPTPMQPPMRMPARMPVQQPPMRMPVQPARPQPRFQPAPRPIPPPATIPPPRQPMQQARPMPQPMPPQGRMQGVQGVLTGTRAPAQPPRQDQGTQAFRERTINQLTPQQQQVYQDASRMGGNIDPLAVAMGGPNALQQARQMQMYQQDQPMQDQPTQGPDRNRIYSAEEQGQRQRLAEAQASMPPAVFNAMAPEMQGMGGQANIMERLRQLLRGQQ